MTRGRLLVVCLALLVAPASASAQIFVSTGANSGLRLYYPNSNDWWVDPSAGRFDLRANGGAVPALSISSGGSVGIGTTTPAGKLDVNGSICLSGTSCITSWPGSNPVYGAAGTTPVDAVYVDGSGRVGVGTTSPSAALDVEAASYRLTANSATKEFTVAFPNGVANQKVDFYMTGTQILWGTIEVAVVDGFNYQNAAGLIKKVYGVGLNPGGAIYSNESRYTVVLGATPDDWALSDLSWDAANGRYKITLVHRVSTANGPRVSITAFSNNSSEIDDAATFTAGSVYTTDATVYGRPYEYFNGNVGMGTTAPTQAQLVVSGAYPQLALNDPSSGAGDILSFLDAGVYRQGIGHFNSTSYLQFATGGTDSSGTGLSPRMTIDQNGKVGIGTTSPGSSLHLIASSNAQLPASSGTTPTGMARFDDQFGIAIDFGSTGGPGYPAWIQAHGDSNQATNYPLALNPNGGSVGVGTLNPISTLDVRGGDIWVGTGGNMFQAAYTTGGTSYHGSFDWYGLQLGNNGDNWIVAGRTAVNGQLRFVVNNTSDFPTVNGTTAMSILADGYVGIGTTNPTRGVLHVAGGRINLEGNSSDGAAVITLGNATYPTAVIDTPYSGGTLQLAGVTGTGLFINASGQVGVGTTSPGVALEVNGSVRATSYLNGGNTRRYFRLTVTNGTSGTTTMQIAELELFDSLTDQYITNNMTSGNTPSPKVVTATATGYTSSAGWKAFDGVGPTTDYNNGYMTSSTSSQLEIDLGSGNGIRLQKYRIWTSAYSDSGGTYRPSAWTMESSNDGSTWTTVDTRSSFPPVSGGYVEFYCATIP